MAIAFVQLPFAIPLFGIEAGNGLPFDLIVRIFIPYYILKILAAMLDTPSNKTRLPFHKQVRHPKNYTFVGNSSIALLQG